MKKLFSFVAAALVSVSMLAVDGVNVMASGLKAVVNDAATEMTIDFVLNTAATDLTVQFFDAAGDLAAEVELEDASLLTAGAHQTTVEIPLDELEEGESYSWGIVAEGGTTVFENKLPVGDPRYSYYLPQDVVVDNSFESEYFGRIYISMPWEGESDGGTETTQNQERGIYILDTQLETVNGADSALHAYNGGLGGEIHARNGFKRLALDEAGNLYIASRDAATQGVYRMDPAHPENPFMTVLAASAGVDAIDVDGGKLYTIEGIGGEDGGFVKTYDLTTVPVGEATKAWEAGPMTLANYDVSIRCDRFGGFWVIQNRWGADGYAALLHLTKKGKIDYIVNAESNTDLLANNDGGLTYRGTMGVSMDGSMIAVSSNRRAVVFAVEYDSVPILTKLCETPKIGSNIDGIAFDAAENLYVASASAEQFHMYPMAKEEGMNHCLTYAPSKYAIEVESTVPAERVILGVKTPVNGAPTTGILLDGTFTEEPLTLEPGQGDPGWYIHYNVMATADDSFILYDAADEMNAIYVKNAEGGWELGVFVFGDFWTDDTWKGDPVKFVEIDMSDNSKYAWANAIPEGLDNVTVNHMTKLVRNGQVIIIRNGVEYNMLGTEMK